jgi:hypothetical protein
MALLRSDARKIGPGARDAARRMIAVEREEQHLAIR